MKPAMLLSNLETLKYSWKGIRMIYDTYHGWWWKCDICGKASFPDIPRYATGTSAMRAYKKHRKECKNQQEAKVSE